MGHQYVPDGASAVHSWIQLDLSTHPPSLQVFRREEAERHS